MKVGSMFAGIGGFDLGFERAGFEVAWCIEWDKNAQAVLRKRFPEATIYGDIREVDPAQLARVDVVCGGFPCQDLSVAGKRAGLAGERSGLFHDAMRLVRQLNPKLLVLENVPGLLSSNHGRDFATVLREVGEGWDCEEVAWRVLDSQYFGVAQRRRRVFIVASASVGCSEEVLAFTESSGGNPPSRGKAREDVAADAARGFAGTRESSVAASLQTTCQDYSRADGFNMVVQPFSPHGHYNYQQSNESATLQDRENRINGSTHLVAYRKSKRAQSVTDDETWVDDGLANTLNGFDTGDTRTTHAVAHAFYSTDGSHGVNQTSELRPPLKIGSSLGIPSPPAVAFKTGNSAKSRSDGLASEQSPTLGSNAGGNTVPAVSMGMVVRRLTPVECERLQGFPDGWTQIGTAEKPAADSHRYKQLGNAVTVNVAEWIARRAYKCLSSH
jgi:DNA (cytosine-5)-methyltransferase 1